MSHFSGPWLLGFLAHKMRTHTARSQGKSAKKTLNEAWSQNWWLVVVLLSPTLTGRPGPSGSRPRTPGQGSSSPSLTNTTRASSPPAGLLGSPRPSCPGALPSPTAHFFPNVRQAAHPTPKTAEPGNGDTFPQGQRDFSLPRIDFVLPHPLTPHLPRWQGEIQRETPPGREILNFKQGRGPAWPVLEAGDRGSGRPASGGCGAQTQTNGS